MKPWAMVFKSKKRYRFQFDTIVPIKKLTINFLAKLVQFAVQKIEI